MVQDEHTTDGAKTEKTIEERRLDAFVTNMNRQQRRAYQSERNRGKSRLEAVQAMRAIHANR